MGALVEREVSARALEAHVLERLHELVLVRRVSTERLQRLIERAHAVVLLHREDVRKQRVRLLEVGDEFLVLGILELDRPEQGGDRSVREILHLSQDVLLGEEARAVHLVPRGGESERVPALDEPDRVGAREEGVHVLRRLVLDLRDEGGEIGIAEWRCHLAGHAAAVFGDAGGEVGRGLRSEAVVRVREEPLFGAFRGQVIADRIGDLVRRERGAEDVRALARRRAVRGIAGERVASGVRVDEDQLGRVDRIADAVCERGRHHAHHHVNLVLVDELLGRRDPRSGHVCVIRVDRRHMAIRELLVVLFQVQLGRAPHRVAELRIHTGEGQEQADLELLARCDTRRCARRDRAGRACGQSGGGGRDEELSPRESIGVSALLRKLVLTESAHEAPSHRGERRKYGSGQDSRSKRVARPCPTPMHIVAMP